MKLGKNYYQSWWFVLFLAFQSSQGLAANCESAVGTKIEAFRAEIIAIADLAVGKGISPLRGAEVSFIDPGATSGTHIISLGSGPDIFRPLRDFPLATDYHLVDGMAGWGAGPRDVIESINVRLEALATAGGKVTMLDQGFLGRVSDLELKDADALWDRFGLTRELVKSPAVWRVEWNSKSMGPQTKTVYLHAMNYDHPTQVDWLLESLGKAELGGIILTGAPVPKNGNFLKFLGRLRNDGQFFGELNWVKPDGTSLNPDDEALVKDMAKFGLLVETPGDPVIMELIKSGRPLNRPHNYLFTKRNPAH